MVTFDWLAGSSICIIIPQWVSWALSFPQRCQSWSYTP